MVTDARQRSLLEGTIRWRWPGRRRLLHFVLACGAFSLFAHAPLAAQQPAPQSCFFARPPADCRSFWITESQVGVLLTGVADPDSRLRTGIEVGWMRTRGERAAIGVGIAAVSGYDDFAVSLRPRYRRWIAPRITLDVSPGLQWLPGRIEVLEARAALSWRDQIGLWGQVDIDLGRSEVLALTGVRFGREAGLVSYALGALGLLYFLLTFEST